MVHHHPLPMYPEKILLLSELTVFRKDTAFDCLSRELCRLRAKGREEPSDRAVSTLAVKAGYSGRFMVALGFLQSRISNCAAVDVSPEIAPATVHCSQQRWCTGLFVSRQVIKSQLYRVSLLRPNIGQPQNSGRSVAPCPFATLWTTQGTIADAN